MLTKQNYIILQNKIVPKKSILGGKILILANPKIVNLRKIPSTLNASMQRWNSCIIKKADRKEPILHWNSHIINCTMQTFPLGFRTDTKHFPNRPQPWIALFINLTCFFLIVSWLYLAKLESPNSSAILK